MTRPNRRNDQSTSQEEQSQTDAHSASLQTQLQQFVPYIEGPKMDWTVNDGLYHRLLKWKLKCENILDCHLPEIVKMAIITHRVNIETYNKNQTPLSLGQSSTLT